MKRKEIEIGQSYAVYAGGYFRPSGKLIDRSKEFEGEHYQTNRGVPKRYVAEHAVVEGKVIATDAVRYASTSTWHNNYRAMQDGILIELSKPLAHYHQEPVTMLVVQPQHVLRAWAEEKTKRAAAKKARQRHAEAKQQAKLDRAARAEEYRALGLVVEDPDRSSLDRDYSLNLDVEWNEYGDDSGSIKVTDWGTEKLLALVEGYREVINMHWSPEQAAQQHQLVMARAVALQHVEDEEVED